MNRGNHPYDEKATGEASQNNVKINISYSVSDKNKSFFTMNNIILIGIIIGIIVILFYAIYKNYKKKKKINKRFYVFFCCNNVYEINIYTKTI